VDPAALLADLDADQRAAVATESTLVAVIAGAGSGKTRVLTRRIAHRIAVGHADAAHTLALTFTREAAGELRRRLVHLGLTDQITAGTFHAVAHQLLRQRWTDHDQAPRSVVTDRARLIGSLPMVAGRRAGVDLQGLVDDVSFASARGLTPDQYVQRVRRGEARSLNDPDFVAEVMRAFAAEKHRRRVVDFDDLLAMTIDGLARDAAWADAVRWRFRHLLVDEAQDLNPLQHRMIEMIRGDRDDVFLVGDPAQAIYGFTGSDPALLVDVADRFPGIEVVRLPVNHRCTPQVVQTGRFVLRRAGVGGDIASARSDGPPVTIRSHDDEQHEAAVVAASIARADPGIVRNGQVAVLARTHATLTATRAALTAARIPIRVRVAGAGSALGALLDEAYRLREPDALRRWIRDQHELAEDDDDPRREVALAANDFLRDHPTGDGAALRAWIGATDPFGIADAGVELLTFHAAKGREWHTVHLVGCETSLVPHRSATTNALRAEEARLFYVAVTRATDALTVHWAKRRAGYQRQSTPLLDGYVAQEPQPVPPPAELVGIEPSAKDTALERLGEWRHHAARASGILPDALCSDKTLALIAEHRPASPDELDELTGLGAITARRLWPGIASALAVASARSAPP
jgi:DNA helicase-2/ATP-dependent DNA helicase PcrA